MNPMITIVQSSPSSPKSSEISVHVVGDRVHALELLSIGTMQVLELFQIDMVEYLEFLMEAKETPPVKRTFVDSSLLATITEQNY